MIGEITWKELSPELQERISSCTGSGTGSSFSIIKNITTEKVVVEVQDQISFTIPFENYDPITTYLDVKINSTWVNPERYTIDGLTITLDEGQDIGTKIFFTLYELGECTPDGGYIQDVDVADTPQEIIIYDGSVIDEKVTAHNAEATAHADIRALINGKAPAVHRHNVSDIDGLDGVGGASSWEDLTGKPESFPPSTHVHTKAEITDFAHTHQASDIEGLSTEVAWSNVTGKPETFPPSTHTHDYAPTVHNHDANYAPIVHTHDYAPVTHSHSDYSLTTHNHDGTYLGAQPSSIPFPFTNGSSTLSFNSSTRKFQYSYYSRSTSGVTVRKTYTIPYEDTSSSSGASETQYDLTLLNGWELNTNVGGYPSKAITKIGNVVHVHTVLMNGTGSGYIASLPTECIPSTSRFVFITASYSPCGVMITTDGKIAVMDMMSDTSFVVLNFFYYI